MDEERETAQVEQGAVGQPGEEQPLSGGQRSAADTGKLAVGHELSGATTPAAARSASPSPSATPTFSGTNRPARRARRLRWQTGIPASMTALTLFSFTLLAGGVAGYVSTIPGLLYEPSVPSLMPLGIAFASTEGAGQTSVLQAGTASRAVGPVSEQASDSQRSTASAALGLGAQGGVLGATTLAVGSPVAAVDSSFTKAVEAAKEKEEASSSKPSEGTSDGSSSSGGNSKGPSSGNSGETPDKPAENPEPTPAPTPSGPSEAEEEQVHAVLVDHLGRLNAYVARLNAAINAFGNDALYGSMDTRQADYNECAAIDSQTLTDFLTLRNYSCPADSRWAEQKGNLQIAYLALDRALTPYYDAWSFNLDYANPADGYNRWMEPIWNDQDASGNSKTAAQLNEALASINL